MTPTEVLKAQELVYELKIGDIMTRRLITVSPETTMREVKQVLRDHRISGLPVMRDEHLVGIVSIEDLIRALEANELDAEVNTYMSSLVRTVGEGESAVRALSAFGRAGVGRLPVVDDDGRLVGILTPGDITRGVLRALERAYHEEELRKYRVRHVFEDIASDRTSLILRYDIPVRDFNRAGRASSQLKQTLVRLGIDPRIVRRVAIVSYEAEMNIVIHSTTGGNLVAEINSELIAVLAYDSGPGIEDVKAAMQPGWSTAPDWIREMGFGAGMGLVNIKATADEMHLDSWPRRGTKLEAVIYLKPGEGKTGHETE
ncbi:MAG: CBS domain-containing protein [Anaerolineae bacterium]|jgi:CBS domain-containing protein/anti-sigma regulatory factor (Ser/Thr protein kinase)|nr:CBS domain-containing protein [Anaerolineae bacterium]